MPVKKENKTEPASNASQKGIEKKETKRKKQKVSIKPAVKSEEPLADEFSVNKEESAKASNGKEAFDRPDDEIQREIEKATREGDKSKFIEVIGRRKTSSARVRLFTQGKKGIIINGKPHTDFFTVIDLQKIVEDPMEKLKCLDKFGVTVIVKGGGITGQAGAVRHGIARALVKLNPYFKKRLKKFGFLTRDSRMRERKKPGLKRARRAPQWSKR